MREIVLDTETTGFDPATGDRLVEIGCLEIVNLVPTGKTYWVYINPERDIPEAATRVHGITSEFVKDKPKFHEEVDNFLEFIADSPLVIHNAAFDMKFLNYQLQEIGREPIPYERAVDTLAMARRMFPGQPASLDALCRRFSVDTTKREKHGALIDVELLAEVYLELRGGRQPGLAVEVVTNSQNITQLERTFRAPRTSLAGCAAGTEERAAHDAFLAKFKSTPLWTQVEDEPASTEDVTDQATALTA